MAEQKKIAVVLLNLGGPDSLSAVRPFLFNLFNDKNIIGLPKPFRFLLAKLISGRREKEASEIYRALGGKSPLLDNTEAQADALVAAWDGPEEIKTFIAMRYWHPMTDAAVAAVQEWGPDEVVLLPLYPQYSTTTTGSSFEAWDIAAKKAGLKVPTRKPCCYPREERFIAAHVELILPRLRDAMAAGKTRLLLSAHGLPKKVVAGGDPYQHQVEETAAAVVEGLRAELGDGFEPIVCFQSRVGPLEWIGPDTEGEIKRAGADGVNVVITPIAFVSEHSETLYELDIEYGEVAKDAGVSIYSRVPSLQSADGYIKALVNVLKNRSNCKRFCPAAFTRCHQGNIK